MEAKDCKKELIEIIELLFIKRGSDIHFNTNNKPALRINKKLLPIAHKEILSKENILEFVNILLKADSLEKLKKEKQVLFSYKTTLLNSEKINFRGNIYKERDGYAIALRLIPLKIKTIKELGLPPILEDIANEKSGFFLLAGPANSGKSTSLSAMINYISTTVNKSIVTIEDPVEFLYQDDKSIISQREVPYDVATFLAAINNALRADIDILMIGEMRELPTMKAALTAAEIGHLVLSTIHSSSASKTINRIVDSFPAEQQRQIINQLSYSLLGICSIKLIPKVDGNLIPVCELLLNNKAVSNLIREKNYAGIDTVIETSSNEGMMSFERSLSNLVKEGVIGLDTAYQYTSNKKVLDKYI